MGANREKAGATVSLALFLRHLSRARPSPPPPPPDLSQHSVLIRKPAPPLVPDLSQPSVPNHYLPPSANVWIYLPPTVTSSVPPRRRTRAHPFRLILSFSVNTAGFPVVGLGFVLQHAPPFFFSFSPSTACPNRLLCPILSFSVKTIGFLVVVLGIVRQHALQQSCNLGFSTGFDATLFPKRFVEEIERTVRRSGVGWWTLRIYFNGHPFWRSGDLHWIDLQ
ncbi:hypothetical protein KSP40_PGU003507 [Platanthera guangdongensis]|uniref:Uncharacterized protein n=1 Tax=Platanthera guangdongensis TaxID=2320717 RepID=A0ABR2LU37_9ASPA